MSATNNPAVAAAVSPIHGLPIFTVTADAVNAPANIMPSSAMLMTPPRSEYIPPSEASVRGVAYLTIDASSDRLIIVRSIEPCTGGPPWPPLSPRTARLPMRGGHGGPPIQVRLFPIYVARRRETSLRKRQIK